MGSLPQNTEIIVYRLVQECCNNIAKHSEATHVNISVASSDGMVRLVVEDNGIGFKVEEALARRDSFGLSGMRERVALLGGKFVVNSFPDGAARERGTKIRIAPDDQNFDTATLTNDDAVPMVAEDTLPKDVMYHAPALSGTYLPPTTKL